MTRTRKSQELKCPCGSRALEAQSEQPGRGEPPLLRCKSCGASVRVDKTTFALHSYAKSGAASADFLRLFDLK